MATAQLLADVALLAVSAAHHVVYAAVGDATYRALANGA
jgi:hypothetical protein